MPRKVDTFQIPPPGRLEAPARSESTLPGIRLASIAGRIVEWGLYVLIVFTPLAFGTVESWSIALAEVLIFTVAFAWGLRMMALGQLRIERTPFNLFWLLVLVLGLLQLIPLPLPVIEIISPKAYALYRDAAIDSGLSPSWRTLSLYPYATKQEVLRLFALALLFWIVTNHLRAREQVDRIVRVVIGMGFLLAVFGIIQNFTGNGKLYWVKELTHGGIYFGPYVNRNHFAGYMEMVIPLTLGYVVATRRTGPTVAPGWRERLLRWGTPEASRSLLTFFAGLVMMAALLLTGSRAGLFSFFGSMLFMALLLSIRGVRRKKWWKLVTLFIVLGFACALWLKPEKVLQTFAILWLGTADPSAQGRLFVWQDTVRLGLDYRWSGAGLNTFSWVFPLYKRALSGQVLYTHAENDYLQAFAEGGLPLAAILAVALLWGGTQLLKGWAESQRSYTRGIGLGLLGGLVAILLHSAGDFNLHILANGILFVLLLALACRVLVLGCLRETLR